MCIILKSTLSHSEREALIDAAIAETKGHFEKLEAQFTVPKDAAFYATESRPDFFNRGSKESLMQGKGRLEFEDMIRKAELKLLQHERKHNANIHEKAAELAKELFHKPGSLLTEEELVKIYGSGSCRTLPNTNSASCTFPTVNFFRTFDGTCNNMANQNQGSAFTPFRRILPAQYEDGFSSARGTLQNYGSLLPIGPFNPPNPSPRFISRNIILDMSINEPTATHMTMQWGQFLAHDMSLASALNGACTGCQLSDICLPIYVQNNDPTFGVGTRTNGSCLAFIRTIPSCLTGPGGTVIARQQTNDLPSYLDASQVYGSVKGIPDNLREFAGGRLLVGYVLPGNNKPSLPLTSDLSGFMAGESRVNENPTLMVLQTIFNREHNRIAKVLGSMNPQWNDERIYQEARKIVGAELQRITYYEYLPMMLGYAAYNALIGPYKGYDPNADASVPNEFATAAARVGHSMVNTILYRLQSDYVTSIPAGNITMAFFQRMPSYYNASLGTDPLLRGLVTENMRRGDEFLDSILTNNLFGAANGGAADLASRNIQRGRDHGLPPYPVVKTWCQNTYNISSTFANALTLVSLLQTYGSLDTIDLWVGGLAEQRLPNALMGATFACIYANAFTYSRSGDRFYFENPGVFTSNQLNQISKASLSRIICDNSDDITQIQPSAFLANQSRVSCSSLPSVDLTQWFEPLCQMGISVGPRSYAVTITSLNPAPSVVTFPPSTTASFGCVQIPCATAGATPQVVLSSSPASSSITKSSALPANAMSSNSAYAATLTFSMFTSSSSGVYTSPTACQQSTTAGLTFTFPAMLDSSAVQGDGLPSCDVLSPSCAKYPLSKEVLDFISTQKITAVPSQTEVKEPLLDISASNEALLRELEEDLNSLASNKN